VANKLAEKARVAKRGEVKVKAVKAAPAKQAAVKAPTEA
jgi:hypothetical protein